MANLSLTSDCPTVTTTVSNIFIDNYMTIANGEFVKVYLYLLRCYQAKKEITISKIADLLEITEKDVLRALNYWEKNHLLRLSYESSSLSGVQFLTPETNALTLEDETLSEIPEPVKQEASIETISPAIKEAVSSISNREFTHLNAAPTKKSYSLDEIESFIKSEDLAELVFLMETYLKHPLSSSDLDIVLYWIDQLNFSTDLIIYLVEYCISQNHSSLRYMDKIAISWHSEGICTVERAKDATAQHSKAYYAVMKALGITGRSLVDGELAFLKKWTKQYAFDLDIIKSACARTIAATHQPSFEYTDKILSNWYQNKVHTLKDVEALDLAHASAKSTKKGTVSTATSSRNKFNNFEQRDYDYDELESILLTTPLQ